MAINVGKNLQLAQNININKNIELITDNEQNNMTIYTDGSKVKGKGSVRVACYCEKLEINETISINKRSSVFTAECLAIREAVKIAIDHPGNNYHIMSDSLSALTSLHNPVDSIRTNKYILESKEMYFKYINHPSHNVPHHIHFTWIPAHQGIDGNEKADRLAKKATSEAFDPYATIPYTDLEKIYKKNSRQLTQEWSKKKGETKGKEYFRHFFVPRSKPWFYNKKLSREFIVWVNRARANHYHLASSLARIGFIDDEQCNCGESIQDLDHVLWQCKDYEIERTKMVKRLLKNKYFPPYWTRTILQEYQNTGDNK